jgi:hypothetical protein
LSAILGAVGLSGCYDTAPPVNLHEPGAYKGQVDPLVKKSATAQFDEQLEQRFKMVQTDR